MPGASGRNSGAKTRGRLVGKIVDRVDSQVDEGLDRCRCWHASRAAELESAGRIRSERQRAERELG